MMNKNEILDFLTVLAKEDDKYKTILENWTNLDVMDECLTLVEILSNN